MIYVVISLNLLAGVAAASMQSIISNAADSTSQGRTMGAVSSLNSLMAVCAPVIALELLRWVSHRPPGDMLIGLPFFTCAALQGLAMLIALRFFHHQPAAAAPKPV